MNNFSELKLAEPLNKALEKINFTEPTPIQSKMIPIAMEGKDVLGTAQTGTGKTAAFSIPMIEKLLANPRSQALILAPTRELASQITQAIKELLTFTRIRTALLIGGEPIKKQFSQLDANPRIIIGTPGRITDHLERGRLKLNHVDFLVLDETDRMLEMGFAEQLQQIAKYLTGKRQTLLLSATMSKKMEGVAQSYLTAPVRVEAGVQNKPAEKVNQTTVKKNDAEKYPFLLDELEHRQGSVIVFARTKRGTEKLAKRLKQQNQEVAYMHGDLHQRKRESVMRNFKSKRCRILVATDIAARGIDVPHVEHVINYDLPRSPEDYIHRIGRTARAGASGEALNIVSPADSSNWRAIEQLLDPSKKPEHSKKPRRFFKGGRRPQKRNNFSGPKRVNRNAA